jgi:hypothetical protein
MLFRLLLTLAALLIVTPAKAAFDTGDLICETTTTTGTGTVNLGGAVSNYVTFVSQIASGNTVPYHIRASDGKLETGIGTFTDATPDTLSRTADWSTDGSGAELTLPAGTHNVCLGPISGSIVHNPSVETIELAADATYDIGTSTVGINDLHIGSTGGVINFDGGDVTITHSAANTLMFEGATTYNFGAGATGLTTFDTSYGGTPQVQNIGTTGSTSGIASVAFSATVNPSLQLARSAGTTVADYTAVAAADPLGRVSFQGSDGNGFTDAALIRGDVDTGTVGDGDMPGRLIFGTTADGSANPAEHLIITSTGRMIHNTQGQIAHYWVYWTGNSTTILASHNVSSIDDDAAGDAGINLTDGFSSNNYAAFVDTNDTTNGWDNEEVQSSGINVHTASVVDVLCATITDGTTAATNLTDPDQWQSVGFGDD